MPPQEHTPEYSLHNLFETNLFLGLSCVVYRLPQQESARFISGSLVKITDQIPPQSTFLISGFETEKGIYALQEIYSQQLTKFQPGDPQISLPQTEKRLPQTQSESHYKEIVAKAVLEIESGILGKAVLSRSFKIPLPEAFSPINFFIKLTEKYPDAFVYMYICPELGNWIGATPELLLQTENNTLKTIALAGTRHITTGEKMLHADESFDIKERHEQNVVTKYIEEKLRPFTTSIKISHTDIKKAGNLYHLVSRFTADLSSDVKDIQLKILQNLHPTPAVGGIPLKEAKAFIQENENYDRELYSGFLGPVNTNGDVRLYVNLRCMQFNKIEAVLYAGAGIVKGSDPEKEWQETQQKMRTLLDVIETM